MTIVLTCQRFTPPYLDAANEDDFLPTWAEGDPTGDGPALVPLVHELTSGALPETAQEENAVMGAARGGGGGGPSDAGACVRCVATGDMAAGELVIPRDPWG